MRGHGHIHSRTGVIDDTPLITWPCYEPSGLNVTLTEEELVQHLLIVGSTGSGKTTLLLHALQQLIPRGIGLLILDAKGDDTVLRVREAAQRCGREVVVLGPEGTHAVDLFGPLQTLDDVELLTQRLLLATDPIDRNNPFWQTSMAAMLSAALTLLLVKRKPVRYGDAVEFMRRWFFSLENGLPKVVANVVEKIKRDLKQFEAPPQLLTALDHVEVWKQLDPRTRSNLQACLLNVIKPLTNSLAVRCFDAQARPAFDPAQVATGQLCVVSTNALRHPELTTFLLRLTQQMLFDFVQQRGAGEHSLCGLVADELPLILRHETAFADALATLRSRRCFVLSATQGINVLLDRLGERVCRSVLVNFNTLIFMRTREPEANEFATASLGQLPPRRRRRPSTWQDSTVAMMYRLRPESPPTWVCPPGGLGRLAPHQGYVLKSDGTVIPERVWFVPWFELAELSKAEQVATNSAEAVTEAGAASRLLKMMERCGFPLLHSVAVISAALQLDTAAHEQALEHAQNFFRSKACMIPHGLETLPTPWLLGLPGILWSLRQPHWTHVPYLISRVTCVDGALLLNFAQEDQAPDDSVTSWDQIRVNVNARLSPSRWRRLNRRQQWRLWAAHAELRPLLDGERIDRFSPPAPA